MASPYAIPGFVMKIGKTTPFTWVSEAQMSGSPPSGWQNTRYFYHILPF